MADTPYTLFLQSFLAGTYDLASASLKLMLVNIAGGHYVPDFATDQYLSVISSGDRVAESSALTSVTITDGVLEAANTVFTSASGAQCGAMVLFIDTGTPSTSPLIYYLDSYSGLPVTPNGSNINVAFSGSGIFEMT